MSEIHFRPLPIESDYTAAAELCEEELAESGGPWVATFAFEMNAHNAAFDHNLLRRSGVIARKVEPLDNDNTPYDDLSSATHAFKHGMIIGYHVIDLAHNGIVNPEHVLTTLSSSQSESTKSAGGLLLDETPLIDQGESGLKFAGEGAVAIIEKWGRDVVSDARVRRMYSLGCGAVIYAAYGVHTRHNAALIAEYLDDYDWSKELEDIESSTTGE